MRPMTANANFQRVGADTRHSKIAVLPVVTRSLPVCGRRDRGIPSLSDPLITVHSFPLLPTAHAQIQQRFDL